MPVQPPDRAEGRPGRGGAGPPPGAPRIPGLEIEEEIGRGAHSVVYRARRGERSFAVKIQRSGVADLAGDAALRFRREGAILACLRHPGLPAILELGDADGRPYIVQELVRGQTLGQLLEEGPLPQPAVVAIGKRLAGALAEVHRSGTVHCDVKPDNVLIDEAGSARLIDFGFAVRLGLERAGDEVVGTLLYAAPEQTGMIKRPLDGRTDWYALGALLYECATGTPPFEAQDAGELIRLHAVQPVPDPRDRNPSVTPALAAVLGKLLAKDPDDRYQSRDGLVGDLDRLEVIGAALAEDQAPPLGVHDRPAKTFIEPALVGRGPVLDQLRYYWDRARAGRGSFVVLRGAPGHGKSRVLHELALRVGTSGAAVMTGSASEDAMPFAALREAVEDVLRRTEPEDQPALDARLREAAGDAAPLLRRFSPELGRRLGDAPEEPGLQEVRDQFFDAAAHFLVRFARGTGGALLLLDDAQRLDDGSEQVLHRMAALMREAPVLVVAAVRDDDPGAEHAIAFFDEMGTGLSHRVELPPLEDDATARLIAALLGDIEAPLDFGPRLASRCAGSPMAAVELVRATLEAGLLRPSWGTWLLDESGLEDLDLPTGLRALVVRRVERLTEATRRILAAAAVIGTRFDAHLLPDVCEADPHEWHLAVGEGLRLRVVEREEGGHYRFVHNDIREALLEELDPDRERALHQRIAEVLDARGGEGTDHLYAVARHFNLGDVDDDPERVVSANLAAADCARDGYAHEEAYGFLALAQTCADRGGIALPPDFLERFAEVAARTGRLAEAIHHFEQALEATTEPLRRARLQAKLAHTHVANFHMGDAWRSVRAGFEELHLPFPRWRPWQLLTTGVLWLRGLIGDRLGGGSPARGQERERHELYVQLCEYGAIQGYFDSRLVLMAQLVARAYWHATRIGPSPELVTVYSQLAVGFAAAGLRRAAGWYSDRAERVAEQLGDRLVLARCRLYAGFVAHLSGESVLAEQRMAAALDEHGKWLDSMHYVDGSGDHVFNLVLRGYFREALTWVERQVPRLTFTSGGVRRKQGNPWGGPILVALGRTNDGADLQDRTRDFVEAAPRSERYLWAELLSYRILFQLELGDCGPLVDRAIEEHRALGMTPLSTQFHCRSFYVFQAYARLEQAMRAGADTREAALRRLEHAVRELHRAALIPSLRAHAEAGEAALLRLRGEDERAERMLHRAERTARRVDSPWVLYECARQRALLLSAQGHRAAAAREARTALGIAGDHGWVYRARRIRAEFEIGHTSRLTISANPSRSVRETSHAGALRLRRQLDALMQVSTAAATVLDPDRQARTALDEIVRILGAERAFLFHHDDDGALAFLAGRDAEGEDLDAPIGFSTTVLERVQSSCQPVVVSGAREGALLGSESVVAHDLRSILAAPLLVRDRLVGALYLDNRLARGVFTEDDTEILLALGTHIGIALETARAAQLEIRVEAETQKRQLAESLREMIQALASTLDLDEVLERLLAAVTQVVPHDRASVFLLQDDQLHRVAPREVLEESLVPGLCVGLEADTVLAEVVDRREPAVIRDRLRDARESAVISSPFRSFLGVPLVSMDRVAGVLTLERREPDAYTASDAEIALTFAGQAGVAIENARLFGEVRRLATTDALTGLLNRRQFFAQAEREFSRWQRYGDALSAAMIDVDHFKRVNDTHGHAVGDEVLAEIARRCQAEVRDVDILGRYGGEEFAVLLPDTGLTGARDHVAERLRARIAAEPVETQKGPVALTISVGVAAADRETPDLGALLERADAALYDAKEGGRDRVVAAPTAPTPEGGDDPQDGKED